MTIALLNDRNMVMGKLHFAELKEALSNVYFIGGAPCAGKSTIADRLAERYNLQPYHIDQMLYPKYDQLDPIRQPVMYKWTTNSWETLWMQPADILFHEVITAYQEQWEMAVHELLQLPRDRAIIADGNPFMPHLVSPVLTNPFQAIWLVPTADFLRETYLNQRKDFVDFILQDCSDPAEAANRWMERDVAFAAWVKQNAANLGLPLLEVDGSRSIEMNAESVADHFRLKV